MISLPLITDQLDDLTLELAIGKFLTAENIKPIVNSATELLLAPGVFATKIPRFLADAKSTASTPTP